MATIRNIIAECFDGKPKRRGAWDAKCLVVHRILFPDIDDPIDMARQFIDNPGVAAYTGGQNPYAFLVLPTGPDIHQCLPLGEVAVHARRWNERAVSIGVVGDFRRHIPTPSQYNNLVELCALLMPAFGLHPLQVTRRSADEVYQLSGHSELPGAYSDPNKRVGGSEECPGPHLSMAALRHDVSGLILAQAQGLVIDAWVVP